MKGKEAAERVGKSGTYELLAAKEPVGEELPCPDGAGLVSHCVNCRNLRRAVVLQGSCFTLVAIIVFFAALLFNVPPPPPLDTT